jgi:PPP family 3-phenylpropionic acid transporter
MIPYWRLSAYYFFYFAFVGAFSPYFALYLQSLDIGATDIALLMSLPQVMRLLAPNLWGWLAERLGVRLPVVRASALLSLAGFALFFLPPRFEGLLVAMALMSFFWSAALPLVESTTFAHLGDHRHRYGSIRVWGSVGFVVVALALGHGLDVLPIRAVLWTAALMLAGIFCCALLVPEAPLLPRVTETASLRATLRRPEVRALLGACLCMAAAHGPLYVFYSIHLVGQGYDKAVVGWMWTLGVLAEIVVFIAMPRLNARFSLRTILLASFACAVLRFMLIGWGVEFLGLLILAQVLHGASFGAYHAAAIEAVSRWFPGRLQAHGQALYGSLSFGAGGMLGGLMSGYAWDTLGAAWTYSLGAGCALAGWVWIVLGWRAAARGAGAQT